MNSFLHLLIILILGIEITFAQSIAVNIVLIIGSALLILLRRPTMKELVAIVLSPLIPAVGTLISQIDFGNAHLGIVLFTRIYAYVWMGSEYLLTVNSTNLITTLEQKLHLPTKFVYGVYGALNLLPQVVKAVKDIRSAALMRGVKLSFLSPNLYFKAILKAIKWSDELELAMHSHGFVEDAPRTHVQKIKIAWWQPILLVIISLAIPFWLGFN